MLVSSFRLSSVCRSHRLVRQVVPNHFSSSSGDVGQDEIEMANARYAGSIEIRQIPVYGRGLFAKRVFEKGDLVMEAMAVETTSQRTSHSVQVGWKQHATMDLPALLINHACYPLANCGIKPNEMGAYNYYALRTIEPEEQLLWDYETSEYKVDHIEQCACGSPQCRGVLEGFHKHGPQVLEAYGKEYVAPYLAETKQA